MSVFKFEHIRIIVNTIRLVGYLNVYRFLFYKFFTKIFFHDKVKNSIGPFFLPFCKIVKINSKVGNDISSFRNNPLGFGWINLYPKGVECPCWHLNLYNGKYFIHKDLKWTKIPDFNISVGDIKVIWELSRFDWALSFARYASVGDHDSLDRLNAWLSDWCVKNPPYFGPNWKCGQEASIRVMHLAMASIILGQTFNPPKGLIDLIELHLRRIAPTVSYAMAQDNNHGTSEAAALFIGGSWLKHSGFEKGDVWYRLGRKWLENRVARLIEKDGGFSQYSFNYHRVMLDTLSMVEVWRRHLGLPQFSELYQERLTAASRWLMAMVDPSTGDGPNLGANDGARLLPLTDTDYRDFRPSVQLAMALFTGARAYTEDGPWNEQLAWLGVELPEQVSELPGSKLFDDGGYAVLRRDKAMVLLRYPRFKFRPSHADALHLDLWLNGENLLRDAGTYSYNTDSEWLVYFPGTVSHNTVQFDDRDQMPRLSRFLFGDWLKTESLQPLVETSEETTFGAAYRDKQGARHQRLVRLMNDRMIVRDEVAGFVEKAVLRWRVKPGDWRLDGQTLSDGRHVLTIGGSVLPARIELVSGWESRYYLQKNPVPVLEVEIHEPAVLTTEYHWAS